MEFYKRVVQSDYFETLKHSKNYFLANLATVGLSVISVPIFTRLYSQEDYGTISLFSSYLNLLIPLITLNAATSIGRYYYEQTDDLDEFIGTTLILVGFTSGILIIITLLFISKISELLLFSNLLILLLVINSILEVMKLIYIQILIPQKRSREVSTISISSAYLSTGLAIGLVLSLDDNIYLGQIYAYLIIRLFYTLYFLKKTLSQTVLQFNKNHFRYILNYSVPLLPYALSGVILAQFDRIMIHQIDSPESVGVYSVGYAIASLLLMVVLATQTALLPDFFKFYKSGKIQRINLLNKRIFMTVLLFAYTLILFTSEIMFLLVDDKFSKASSVVAPVVIGLIFFGLFTVYGRYIGYYKKTFYSSAVMLISGISNIILNAIFIPKYGFIAAAYTTTASYFILFVLTFIVTKNFLHADVTPLAQLISPLLLFAIFLIFPFYFTPYNFHIVIILLSKLTVVGIFGFLLFRDEIKLLISPNKNENQK